MMNDNRNAVGLPSGTLVLTSDGYREIESIKTDDLVLTHKCRWRKVIGVITGQDKVGTFQGNVKISMTSDVNIYGATEVTHGKFTWYHCREFTMTDEVKTVYNLAVEEDNTFFADSICVSTNIF